MRRVGLISLSVATLLLTGNLIAGDAKLSQADKISRVKHVVNKEAKFQSEKFKIASKEISKGLNNTIEAISALGHKDRKKAINLLENATKSFEKALKSNPSLKLVPIDNEIVAFRYSGDIKSIKVATTLAKEALKKHDLQFARDVLNPLKDEIDISTHYIPMDLYPHSTKIALSLLKQGKDEEALQELILGLSTIVGDRVVIPIPLLTAQELIIRASDLDKNRKKEALKFLNQAKTELEKAKYLGYTIGNKKAYKELTAKIENIEKEIRGKNVVEKLYENLKNKVSSLLSKIRNDKKEIRDNKLQTTTSLVGEHSIKKENREVKNSVSSN